MSIESMGNDFMRKYGSASVKKKKRKRRTISQGWVQEPERHSMSAYGVKSGRKKRTYSYYPTKQQFRSAPMIKAGVGILGAGVGATASFLAKRREEMKKKQTEEEAKKKEQQEKEDYYYDGKITAGRKPLEERIENKIPFVEALKKRDAEKTYREAQANALQQREDQYSKVIEARKRRQEQIDKDYASV